MFKELQDYTKFQKILLFIFFVSCFVLSTLLFLDFIKNPNTIIDTSVSAFALFSGFLVIFNSRWSTITRIIYLFLYTIVAFRFKMYIDATIKLLWLLPFAIYKAKQVFPIKSDNEWLNFLKKMDIRRKRIISPKLYYAWITILGIVYIGLYNFFEDIHLHTVDSSIDITFYVFLTISGIVFGYLTKNQSLAKWPYGLIYHSLVFFMWVNLEESFAIDIYCIFWIIYTLLGCIEGFYVQENGIKKSIFLLNLSTMVKKRKEKIKKDNKY